MTFLSYIANCGFHAQVITSELNKVVADLLQQLLYWQERAKALNPMKAKNKRLISGLREVSLRLLVYKSEKHSYSNLPSKAQTGL